MDNRYMFSTSNGQGYDEQPVQASFIPVLEENEDVINMGDGFNLSEFQVVRREFFSHISEPSITFNNCKFGVNMACLSRFPQVDYVLVMVNKRTKILSLKPCSEFTRDAFNWCSTSANGKKKPRQTTGKMFFAIVSDLMGWNPDYKYKILGKTIYANGEYLIAFDLTSTEVYERTFEEGEKPKTSRKPVFPSGWKGQFGLPYEEHQKSLQVNIFDGYAVYSVRDHAGSAEALPLEHLNGATV